MSALRIVDLYKRAAHRSAVRAKVASYAGHYGGAAGVEDRKNGYAGMTNDFYDLVTDFYEIGWGESFHFAPMARGESFEASIARHEHYLAHRLRLEPGMSALDVGCGVGGPMRAIARFSGARVVGINNNAYQIELARAYNAHAGLSRRCDFVHGDFMKMPVAAESFDAAYAVEATCHAPDKAGCFAEVFRVLRPGARFAGYEWCLTPSWDAANPEHVAICRGIEEGNSLPALASTDEVVRALEAAGFEVLDHRDVALDSDPETPWYTPLSGDGLSLRTMAQSPVGRWLTERTVTVLESVGLAPEGTKRVSALLNDAATHLVNGGKTGCFTPMYFFCARKPG